MDIRQEYHGIPLYLWGSSGLLALAGSVWWLRRYRAAKLANAGTPGVSDGTSYAYGSPLPGMGGLGSMLGAGYGGGGASTATQPTADVAVPATTEQESTPIIESIINGLAPYLAPVSQPVAEPQPQPAYSPPATTVSAGSPANTYALGQQLTPLERVVSSIWSPVYGWLNETNLGGVYTGGGGTADIGSLDYGGSYLGYVQQQYGVGTPAAQTELATHAKFDSGGLELLPGGGYTLRNDLGEAYSFGS